MMRKLLSTCIIILVFLSPLSFPARAADTDNPRLILSSYVIDNGLSDSAVPGFFTFNYTLLNTSEIGIANTILTYDQRNSAILPVHGSSNVAYIGSVTAGHEYKGSIELYIPSHIVSGLYQFDIILSYNVGDPSIHAQLSGAFSVYIEIINNPELNLKQVELSAELAGNRRYLYIEYENPGTNDFKNLQLVIDGNIAEQQKTQTLPILKAGRSNSIEYPIQFTDTGIQYIDIYLSYNDDTGNAYLTPVITERTNITSNSEINDVPPNIQPSEGYMSRLLNSFIRNMKDPTFLLVLFVSIVLIVGIAFIILRMRKHAIRKKWYFKKNNDRNKK